MMIDIKKYIRIGFLLTCSCALGTTFIACTDDILDNSQDNSGTVEIPTESIYVSLSVKPVAEAGSGTRADDYWKKDGTETPLDEEINIDNMTVVLAYLIRSGDTHSGDYLYGTSGEKQTFQALAYADMTQSSGALEEKSGVVTGTWYLDQSDLENFLGKKGKYEGIEDTDLYVFVIANAKGNPKVDHTVIGRNIQRDITVSTSDLPSLLAEGNVRESKVNLMMTSQEALNLKGISWDDIKDKTNPNDPFKLTQGTDYIPLHREVARIDVDWTRTKFAFTQLENEEQNTTYIANAEKINAEYEATTGIKYNTSLPSETLYSVTIDGVALVNMGKDYYLFQETGEPTEDNKNIGGTWYFLGDEEQENTFLRDPKGDNKIDNNLFMTLSDIKVTQGTSAKTHSDYIFRNVNDFTFKLQDNFIEDIPNFQNSNYAIFSYSLPNVIYDTEDQRKNNATGVIYRAVIGDNAMVTEAGKTGADIYAYGNELYGTFEDFKTAAEVEENKGKHVQVLFDYVWESYEKLVQDNDFWQEKIESIKDQIKQMEDEIADINTIQDVVNNKRTEKEIKEGEKNGAESDDDKARIQGEIDALNEEINASKARMESYLNRYIGRFDKPYSYDDFEKLSAVERKELIDNFIEENRSVIIVLEEEMNNSKSEEKFITDEDTNTVKVNPNFYDEELFRKAALINGIRTYRASNIGTNADPTYKYYCYYYYWIRHNNNGIGNQMGVMEYAIVRNYVYKLSVNKIYDLGYPEVPGDDPDPLIPDDKIEQSDVKIEVHTKIFPWEIRTDDEIILK